MKYISLFSGIEAATVAWEPLGWEAVAFSEIDPFPSAVLAQRFPNVPNLGDITKVDWSEYRGAVDVVVGGSPCQSFSIAGNREGLKGESGLMFEYIRAVREIMPRYFVWENVPGALSCEKGAAFGQLLSEMDDLGYGLAWRVLDAQFFGVAQRRRRVFLVGCLGDAERAAEILFEPESLSWDSPSSREKRKELAADAERGVGGSCLPINTMVATRGWKLGRGTGFGINEDGEAQYTLSATHSHAVAYCIQGDIARGAHMGQNGKGWSDTGECYTLNTMDVHAAAYTLKIRGGCDGGGKGPLIQEDVSATLATNQDQTLFQPANVLCLNDQGGSVMTVQEEIAPTLRAQTHGHEPIVMDRAAFNPKLNPSNGEDYVGALCARDFKGVGNQYVSEGKILFSGNPEYIVRRLTPVECERLQGFPDGWTDVEYKGKKAPDGKRYKALGNSMAVPVMRWIGERIEMLEH